MQYFGNEENSANPARSQIVLDTTQGRKLKAEILKGGESMADLWPQKGTRYARDED